MFLSTQSKHILLTGGSGFIGGAFTYRYAQKYRIGYTYFRNPVQIPKARAFRLNIESEVHMCQLFSEFRPNVVIHAAALSNVAECEKDWKKTYDVNVRATSDLMNLCREVGARVIYLSTDMVFAGTRGNYEETDDPFPGNRYGKSKRLAEEMVYAGAGSPNTVLRLSLVYGFGRPAGPRGFDGWLQEALVANRPVTMFTDELRSPVYIEDVISILDEVVEGDIAGLFHIGGRDKISRYDFGVRFAETLGYNPACVVPGSIRDYPERPARPANLTFNIARAQKRFKTTLAGVEDGLRRMREIQTATDPTPSRRDTEPSPPCPPEPPGAAAS